MFGRPVLAAPRDGPFRLLVLALALATAACGGSSSTAPTNASITGTWALASIGGRALPTNDAAGNLWRSASSTFAANGTYTSTALVRAAGATADQTFNDNGTWQLTDGRVILDGDTTSPITISGSSATQTAGADTFVYRKQ